MEQRKTHTGFFHWPGHAWIALAARLLLGGIFLYACLYKIQDPAAFALSIATYDILPTFLVNALAIALPWVELTAGLMVVFGFRARSGMLLIASMMLMFIVALSFALGRGVDMSCGCFASSDAGEAISALTLVRDICLFILACYALLIDRVPIGLDRWIRKRTESGGVIS